MNTIIDLGSELLIDTSSIRDPYVRLAVAAVGQGLVSGSPWVVVNKQLAVLCNLPSSSNAANQSNTQNQPRKESHHAPSKSSCDAFIFRPSDDLRIGRLSINGTRAGVSRSIGHGRQDDLH